VTQTIQILIILLLGISIVAVIRLWSVLGSVRVTLANLEETRQEADKTLKSLAEVALSTDKVMREEVAPTLQRTRATLEHVEVTTRALAQTTQTISRLTGRAESLTTAQRLISLGGTVAQSVLSGKANKNGAEAVSKINSAASPGFKVAAAVASQLLRMFGRRKVVDPASEERSKQRLESPRRLPEAEYAGKTLTVGKEIPISLLPEEIPTERTRKSGRR